jgi:hypothetical protein
MTWQQGCSWGGVSGAAAWHGKVDGKMNVINKEILFSVLKTF